MNSARLLSDLIPVQAALPGQDTLEPIEYRALGDSARNRGQWQAAAEAYANYLAGHDRDADIWIQLGHTLKEQGALEDAVVAYGRAAELRPESPDAHLQLGRALGLTGRTAAAIGAFQTTLDLAWSVDAYRELSALGLTQLAAEMMESWTASEAETSTFYEVSDLLNYLRVHPTVSGIQRVQASIIAHLSNLPPTERAKHRFVINAETEAGHTLLILQADALVELLRYASGAAVDHAQLRSLIDAVVAKGMPVVPGNGQTYLLLGAFWGSRSTLECARRLKAEGVRIGACIYDLIPITHPEFCDAGLAFDFALSIGDALLCFDFLLTISEHVAGEVRNLLSQAGIGHVPVDVLPLAHNFKGMEARRRAATAPPDRWTRAIAAVKDKPFVLFVSTIEARKNHAYLFHAWRQMLAAGEDMPDLVFVGRRGWRVDDLLSQMRDTGYLDGRLHILHDLTDTELSTLYRNCLFTAFPSFVEGWGLPVGESLAHGVPCIASSTSSMPEVGGDLVDYVDPMNLRDGMRVLRRMLFEPGYREGRRAEIAARFRPRTWHDVTQDLLTALARQEGLRQTGPQGPAPLPLFAAGRIFQPSDLHRGAGRPLPRDYLAFPSRALLVSGWHDCEDFGVWMRNEEANLAFRTDAEPGEEALVYLQLVGAPHIAGQVVTVGPAQGRGRPLPAGKIPAERQVSLRPGERSVVRLALPVGEGGQIAVRLRLDRPAESLTVHDSRRFALGLTLAGWAPVSDVVARQDITESILLGVGTSGR